MNFFDKNNHFNLANSITFANVACGTIALYFVTQKQFLVAIILAWIAGALDIADGKVARKYNLSTEFGVQLDSFADFLSFVIMPAFLLFYSLDVTGFTKFIVGIIFVYYIISGLRRLVTFNLKTDAGSVSKYFEGVPTPLGAILLWILYLLSHTFEIITSPIIIAIFVAIIGWLLNSKVKVPHP